MTGQWFNSFIFGLCICIWVQRKLVWAYPRYLSSYQGYQWENTLSKKNPNILLISLKKTKSKPPRYLEDSPALNHVNLGMVSLESAPNKQLINYKTHLETMESLVDSKSDLGIQLQKVSEMISNMVIKVNTKDVLSQFLKLTNSLDSKFNTVFIQFLIFLLCIY